ncbi:hypothetical protein GW17_00061035 [Ensete ventricosum]|nr:hypothetical protein GW17_00061035 [Ensete ventricosum]
MHPLRFPNSGIKAEVFVRRIGFKLRVMRLNRVESFYTLLLHFHSEGSKEEGRPATASSHAGSATHGQAGYKGQPAAEGGRPATATAPCRGSRARTRCEAVRGSPVTRAAACKGGRSC